jgi:hypothetical protein
MFGDDEFGDDFGLGLGQDHIAGPLVGGGVANVGILATKLMWKDKPAVTKWAGLIGTLLGGGVSAAMMMSPRTRGAGIAGLLTAAIVGVPRQLEDMLMGPAPGATKDYLGVITPEAEMAGYGGGFGEMGSDLSQDIQLLDSGAGSTSVLGITVPEREMSGASDVELLGNAGFGSNFLAQG